ncbi:nucleotidyl transferase AbiEii/AbiGii toxin family protein [uncultured Paludibaculum sp.]|uniref:nucleotidyl transferase AbiEii/AbiGii toxin family protein n=1 Tax=uncultured Paludibaculum sp. TaxID=1765020 RepID=UPI002AABA13D|nr:nucleotidyl transferase AbiEii/AbiGii toxin family protein [uncultured Paludibaculum sp.]
MGINQERLRHWVSFLALCGVLERARQEGIVGVYYLKGGVALELRFALKARATRDLDLGMAGSRADRLQTLSRALRLEFDQFTFRLKAQQLEMENADAVRVQVAIQYRTRAWQTIEVDLGSVTASEVDLVAPNVKGLAELGIPVISPVRCLNLADQLAQKLHACTGPASAGRARDVLDILVMDSLGGIDYSQAGAAARRVFEVRATHPFPPVFVMPPEWRPEVEAIAQELQFPLATAETIEQ